jgi:hypothetical protein
MYIPVKARISLALIAGIGLAVGLFIYGCMVSATSKIGYEAVEFSSIGGGLLAASIIALVMYFQGAFKDIRDDKE